MGWLQAAAESRERPGIFIDGRSGSDPRQQYSVARSVRT